MFNTTTMRRPRWWDRLIDRTTSIMQSGEKERKRRRKGKKEIAKNCHHFLFKFSSKAKIDANTVCPNNFGIAPHTMFETYSKCRIWIFLLWHLPRFFVILKVTFLVTLFDRKLHVFKNSPIWTIFGILMHFCLLIM